MSTSDLLTLQGNVKKDPDGYKEEFRMQFRHYQALLEIFQLQPSKESRELGDLAMFIAQVCNHFPRTCADFPAQLMNLLDTHYALLESSLRRTLVQALILLRNRNQLTAMQLMPLFFKLFKCQDKLLRQLLFKHIISDIKNSNKKHRNEKLNKQLQNFMYSVVGDDDEASAKRSLAVCTELWRRHVWRDARTVNVIASAAYHKSSRVMLAAVKFFLGQDKGDEELEMEEDKGDEDQDKPKAPSKEEVYKAYNSGTRSSKRKKQAKLKRVMHTLKKNTKKDEDRGQEGFAALHLLHDPQTFAERLFGRLQSGNERFETRMAMMNVISRTIGTHKLLVLNFYPFLQKYIAPHTRDVTLVLTALVSASHELVPPDVMTPVLRQLVDQFINDKARPEVMTLGLKTTRELCLRCPLIMTQELLQDLTEYKKFRNKEVSSAARGLIGLFRELQPELLLKKDRGRSADLASRPAVYGATQVADRVDGADLLQAAIDAGQGSEDDEVRISSDEENEGEEGGSMIDLDDLNSDDLDDLESEEGEDNWQEVGSGNEQEGSEGEGEEDEEGSEEMEEGEEGSELEMEEGESDDEGEEGSDEEGSEDATPHHKAGKAKAQEDKQKQTPKLKPQAESLSALKRKLAEAKQRKEQEQRAAAAAAAAVPAPTSGTLLEADRILTEEDFERIRKLKQKRMIEEALSKHGMKSASKAKRARLLEAAEEEAEEALELQERMATINERKVDPKDLEARKKRGHDKASRMATILAGREGRDKFGASTGRKKDKTGGLSEREKQRKKSMPLIARLHQVRKRAETSRQKKKGKNFKGHVRG